MHTKYEEDQEKIVSLLVEFGMSVVEISEIDFD